MTGQPVTSGTDTAPSCGCENPACQVTDGGHYVPPFGADESRWISCPNAGTVPCRWVGALCEPCAAYMPVEYLGVAT